MYPLRMKERIYAFCHRHIAVKSCCHPPIPGRTAIAKNKTATIAPRSQAFVLSRLAMIVSSPINFRSSDFATSTGINLDVLLDIPQPAQLSSLYLSWI